MDSSQLSYFSVGIFIAIGILVVLSIFIFGKRQITRFTIKSARRPHLPTGHSAPKILQQNIQNLLEKSSDIKFEPRLIHNQIEMMPPSVRDSGITCNYKYRMLALDALSAIDVTIDKHYDKSLKRNPSTRLRTYLVTLHNKGPLLCAPIEVLCKFSDAYDHARHITDPFGQHEYEEYIEQLQLIVSYLQQGSGSASITSDTTRKLDTRVNLSGSIKNPAEIITLPVASKRGTRSRTKKEQTPLVYISEASGNIPGSSKGGADIMETKHDR